MVKLIVVWPLSSAKATLKGHCHSSFAVFRSWLVEKLKLVLYLIYNDICYQPKTENQIIIIIILPQKVIEIKIWFYFEIHILHPNLKTLANFFKFRSVSILAILSYRWQKWNSVYYQSYCKGNFGVSFFNDEHLYVMSIHRAFSPHWSSTQMV